LTGFLLSLLENGESDFDLPDWIFQRFSFQSVKDLGLVNGGVIRELVFGLKRGKTCNEDGLVAEMLMALEEPILQMLLAHIEQSRHKRIQEHL
jgi:hypothetical protein